MPSSFNSAARDSAFFWVRSASGWDYVQTRGYDFVRTVQAIVGAPVSGRWGGLTQTKIEEYLRRSGPNGVALADAIFATHGVSPGWDKAVLLAAAWVLVHDSALASGNASSWPMADDIFIPADVEFPPMGDAAPHGGDESPPHVTLVSQGAPQPYALSATQSAPVTSIITHAPVPAPTTPDPTTVIVSTAQGDRAMPVTTPQIILPVGLTTAGRTGPNVATVALVVGGVVLLAGGAYLLSRRAAPAGTSRSRARSRGKRK